MKSLPQRVGILQCPPSKWLEGGTVDGLGDCGWDLTYQTPPTHAVTTPALECQGQCPQGSGTAVGVAGV